MTAPRLRPQNLSVGTCPDCGKQQCPTRRDAVRAARAIHPNTALRAYRCGHGWHVGNTPTWRKRGQYA